MILPMTQLSKKYSKSECKEILQMFNGQIIAANQIDWEQNVAINVRHNLKVLDFIMNDKRAKKRKYKLDKGHGLAHLVTQNLERKIKNHEK